jgi:multiple sugar transport system permease protein
LQTIPRDLEEAIRLEGAGKWTVFWRLQWPLLLPYVALAVLFRLAQAFGVFDLIQILTGGGPAGSTESLALYAYLNAMRFLDFGYSATLILATFVMMVALTLLWLGWMRGQGAQR